MPYRWDNTSEAEEKLCLWAHNALPPRGAIIVIMSVFFLGLIPLIAVLGSVVLWGLLPFLLLTVAGLWLAIEANYRARDVHEVLTLSENQAHLVHHGPRARKQEWSCNRYWARPEIHAAGGPVPNYVTLSGEGRVVEIGAFLSEEERVRLYDELVRRLHRPAAE